MFPITTIISYIYKILKKQDLSQVPEVSIKVPARKSRNYSIPFASYMCFHMRGDLVPKWLGNRNVARWGRGRRRLARMRINLRKSRRIWRTRRGPKSRQISTRRLELRQRLRARLRPGTETESETTSSVYIVTMAIKIKFNPTCINAALTGVGCVWVSSAPDGTMGTDKAEACAWLWVLGLGRAISISCGHKQICQI